MGDLLTEGDLILSHSLSYYTPFHLATLFDLLLGDRIKPGRMINRAYFRPAHVVLRGLQKITRM